MVSEMSAASFAVFSVILLCHIVSTRSDKADEEDGVLYPTKCEVCKYLSVELQDRLEQTGKTHDVIETGYNIDKNRKKTKYRLSELRLVESLDGICDKILQYNIHKERKDSSRFAKGMSETFRTLHGLVDKGVKVELGIPYELWDKPSVEITTMKAQCETMLEEFEADIEDWYFNQQQISLQYFLCEERVLKAGEIECLKESRLQDKKTDKSVSKKAKNKSKVADAKHAADESPQSVGEL